VPKNLCKRTVVLQLIIKNVVTCFFGTQCIFKFLYGPPRFFLRGKFIPKIAIFGDFGGRKDTFLKKVAVGPWGPGRPFPAPNFVKIA